MEKCLPFGASISCSHYQRFSNALRHLIQKRTENKAVTNYLDDFLFAAVTKWLCDNCISLFINLCKELNIPVVMEKTEWGSTMVIFLGILLNCEAMTLCMLIEKRHKVLKLLNDLTGKKKATVKELQVLTGYLNFSTKAIFPGRAFTHTIYAKYSQIEQRKVLKQHHHVRLDVEFRNDCEVWRIFLTHYEENAVCRPMVDLQEIQLADSLQFYSDASKNCILGFRAVFNCQWLCAQWKEDCIKNFDPSIEYLELLGLTAALLTWGHQLKNRRIVIFCDNMSVVHMVNNSASTCKNCMYLLRLITLNNLVHNRQVFAQHIQTDANDLADALSRLQFGRFWKLSPPGMSRHPSKISPLVWPASRIW